MKKGRAIIFSIFLYGAMFFGGVFFSRAAEPTEIAGGTHITKSIVWEKKNSPYLVRGEIFVDSGARLTIEPGVVVKFEYQYGKLNISGELSAIGTANDRIVFTSIRDDSFGGDSNGDGNATTPARGDWQDINFGSGSASGKMKYASVVYAGGGNADDAIVINSTDNVSITRSEIRNNRYHGVKIINALPTIEENVIANNWYGIFSSSSTKTPVLKNNSFSGNSVAVTVLNIWNGTLSGNIDARDNWWGNDTGPTHKSNPGGAGDKISDNVLFDPWLGKNVNDGTPDPVIIIPGIMGSWEVNGQWELDPFLHSYENLKKALDENGYTPNEDMFDFPYQWRDSNIDNAKLLRNAIEVVKEKTKRPKVDLVAHSMGGLLAREYIESDYYQDDVDQLITLGTPHAGAPKAYLMWEAGESYSYLEDKVLKTIFNREAKKSGFENLFYYIHEKIPSLKELLPVYNYLSDLDQKLLRVYPEKYPDNIFLENLNNTGKINRLEKIEFGNIYSKTDKKLTIGGYNIIDAPAFGDYWKDGYPKDFDLTWSNDGFIFVDGDGTVPVESAKTKQSDYEIEVNASHNQIPTEAQQDVIELLTGKRPENKITSEGPEIKEILLVQVYCPIDLQIISPEGDAIGMNFETGDEINEIPRATYVNNGENEEFIVIPNPEDGEYKIITKGTGDGGEYKIEATKITENEDDSHQAEDSSVQIEGSAETGEIKEAKIEVSENEVIYNPDSIPPTIVVSSPEEKDYNNDETLTIGYLVEDKESGVENDSWQVEKDGQVLGWKEKSVDLSLEHLGNYTFKVSATDKAGNSGEKQVEFQITTSLDAIQKNLKHYFELGLIKNRIGYKYFSIKLKNIEKLFGLLEKAKNSKSKPKQAAIEVLEKVINKNIQMIIRQLKQKNPRWVDGEARDFLIESLNAIKVK